MNSLEILNSKSSEELIRLFQNKLEPDRDSAFIILVHRFREDLLKKCEISCKRYGHGPDVAEIIAENTFKAYAQTGTFDFNPLKAKGKTIDESFQIYLYRISKNELINYYRQQEKKRLGHYYDGNETIIVNMPDIPIDRLDAENKLKYSIIQSLPDSHRVVYLTYKAYEKLGCNLPKKLQAELRHYLGDIKQTTIRAYKKEAIDKINQGLEILKMSVTK